MVKKLVKLALKRAKADLKKRVSKIRSKITQTLEQHLNDEIQAPKLWKARANKLLKLDLNHDKIKAILADGVVHLSELEVTMPTKDTILSRMCSLPDPKPGPSARGKPSRVISYWDPLPTIYIEDRVLTFTKINNFEKIFLSNPLTSKVRLEFYALDYSIFGSCSITIGITDGLTIYEWIFYNSL